MARTLTPERQKLKQDAIRLRQELGWSNRRIAAHLNIARRTIDGWVGNNIMPIMGNNSPLHLNQVHVMDCITGMGRLPHESIDLVFADPPWQYDNHNPPKLEEMKVVECPSCGCRFSVKVGRSNNGTDIKKVILQLQEDMNIKKAADNLNLSTPTIYKILRYAGIDPKSITGPRHYHFLY